MLIIWNIKETIEVKRIKLLNIPLLGLHKEGKTSDSCVQGPKSGIREIVFDNFYNLT